jgi:hypothetical protein
MPRPKKNGNKGTAIIVRLFDKPSKKGGKPRIREEIRIENLNDNTLAKLVELIVMANTSQTSEIDLGAEVAKLFKSPQTYNRR